MIREDNLVFNVMEVKDNRITRVELQIEQQPEEEDEDSGGGKKKRCETEEDEKNGKETQ